MALAKQGYVRFEGLRYEDFLPVSAWGIFASNLGQYGHQVHGGGKADLQQEDAGRHHGQKDH